MCKTLHTYMAAINIALLQEMWSQYAMFKLLVQIIRSFFRKIKGLFIKLDVSPCVIRG